MRIYARALFLSSALRRRDVRQRSRLDFERSSGLYVDTPKRFRFLNAERFGTILPRLSFYRAIAREATGLDGKIP